VHNRNAARFIFSALEVRGWTESKLAKAASVARSVVSAQLAGTRKIQPAHLVKYAQVFNHRERMALLIAWLRDHMGSELVEEFLNPAGDGISRHVKRWIPALGPGDKEMLTWWAHEMARDSELQELFKLLSAKAGYRPRRTVTGLVKRRRRGGGAIAALLLLALVLGPTPRSHARQLRAPALALRGRQSFLLPAAEAA
jgi:transcriptional regulator with XRE-family HTH domain